MQRGEVWLSDQPPPAGRRPVLLVGRDSSYQQRELVLVAMITTRPRGVRAEVHIGPAEGLSHPSVANLDTISSMPRARLLHRLGSLAPTRIEEVNTALRWALDLD